MNSTTEGIYGVDINGCCTFVNNTFLELLGFDNQEEVIGENIHRLIQYAYEDGSHFPDENCGMSESIRTGKQTQSDEILWRKDGTMIQVSYSSNPQIENEKVIGAVMSFKDISEKKKSEAEFIYASEHDYLTKLYDRKYFEKTKEKLDQESHFPLSIIIGNMNGLKLINNSFGNIVGDQLIAETGQRIQKYCRKGDILARVGGDEFGILLPNTDYDTSMQTFMNLIREFNEPSRIFGKVNVVDVISFGLGTKNLIDENIQTVLNQATENMTRRKILGNKGTHSAILAGIKAALVEKCMETEEHTDRVVRLCIEVGKAMNLSMVELDKLQLFAYLHDIGKMGIDDSILKKPGKLNENEWKEMKKHSEIGYRIAMSTPELTSIAEFILSHHEKWDGTGYPQGLIGEEIPLLSRILSIVDAYDAMTNDRVYRKALPFETAIDEIKKGSGTQFDPNISTLFIKKISIWE